MNNNQDFLNKWINNFLMKKWNGKLTGFKYWAKEFNKTEKNRTAQVNNLKNSMIKEGNPVVKCKKEKNVIQVTWKF